eukprot:GHVU01020429.1.p2 GENE.GHVU01020429.1~~GHVU01020429.1.p2  ORF type:complete len:135 (-),score=12.53 GHVU01020429.1:561-965(-)
MGPDDYADQLGRTSSVFSAVAIATLYVLGLYLDRLLSRAPADRDKTSSIFQRTLSSTAVAVGAAAFVGPRVARRLRRPEVEWVDAVGLRPPSSWSGCLVFGGLLPSVFLLAGPLLQRVVLKVSEQETSFVRVTA